MVCEWATLAVLNALRQMETSNGALKFPSLQQADPPTLLRNSNWRARVFDPAVQACQKDDESFPTITPHDLRHTAASLAVSAGTNVKALQRMLGHAKASMTLDVYADLFDDDLDSVAESLDAAIVKASSAAIAAVSGGSPAPPLLPQGV